MSKTLPCADICTECGGNTSLEKLGHREIKKCDECGRWHEITQWFAKGNIIYHGDKFVAMIERGDTEYLANYLNESEVFRNQLAAANDRMVQLRGEIRRAVVDWRRFQDFIVGEGPREFDRLIIAGERGKAVIEKFMAYLSSLWNELNQLRCIEDDKTETTK